MRRLHGRVDRGPLCDLTLSIIGGNYENGRYDIKRTRLHLQMKDIQ
jgi:hypothetical protein